MACRTPRPAQAKPASPPLARNDKDDHDLPHLPSCLQAGVKVLATTDAAVGMPLLRLEADDFSQNFDSQAHSSGQISLRASLFRNHRLVDQKTFTRSTDAGSADAAGGARALAASSDAI